MSCASGDGRELVDSGGRQESDGGVAPHWSMIGRQIILILTVVRVDARKRATFNRVVEWIACHEPTTEPECGNASGAVLKARYIEEVAGAVRIIQGV